MSRKTSSGRPKRRRKSAPATARPADATSHASTGVVVAPPPNGKSLLELLSQDETKGLPWTLTAKIARGLLVVAQEMLREGRLIGYANLSTLMWDEAATRITLMQPALQRDGSNLTDLPRSAQLVCPDVRGGCCEQWSVATDGQLAALVVLALLLRRSDLDDETTIRRLGAELPTFLADVPRGLSRWLRLSLARVDERRWSSIAEQMAALELLDAPRPPLSARAIAMGADSRAGIQKMEPADDFRTEDQANQDRYAYAWRVSAGLPEDAEKTDLSAFALVCDGVSTADIGRGDEAAEITRCACMEAFAAGELSSVGGLKVLAAAHRRVVEHAIAIAEKTGMSVHAHHSMATTAVMALARRDGATILSCGDSYAWQWTPEHGLERLNATHNAWCSTVIAALETGQPIPGRREGSMSEITSCLGRVGEDGELDPIEVDRRDIAWSRDAMLIIATDGLPDALGEDLWTAEAVIETTVAGCVANGATAKQIAQQLAWTAEAAGAPDNVTLVVIRPDAD